MSYLLWILILPLLGSLIVLMIPRWNHDWIRTIAFNTSLLNFLISLMLWIEFNKSTGKFQFIAKIPSILEKYDGSSLRPLKTVIINQDYIFSTLNTGLTYDQYGTLNFILGVDGISLFFIILTTFLIPVCLLVGWTTIQTSVKEYCIAFLLLEALMIAAFCVLDLLLFYIFFESVLIPMFLIIGVWGSREKKSQSSVSIVLIHIGWILTNVISYISDILPDRNH